MSSTDYKGIDARPALRAFHSPFKVLKWLNMKDNIKKKKEVLYGNNIAGNKPCYESIR